MNLIFKTLQIKNFMSIEDAQINLSERGFVQVVGKNNNKTDNTLSNGSGKSAIWESLNWCLTGDTIRGSKDVVRRGCDDGTIVTVSFMMDDDSYTITRTRNHEKYKNNLFIHKNGEDISGKGLRDTEVILANVLPEVSSSLLNAIVILGQGLPQRFTNNSPSGRKEVLETLSKSDFMIQDLKDRVDRRKNELESILHDIDRGVDKNEAQLEVYKKSLSELSNRLEELKKVGISSMQEKLLSLKNSLEETTNEIYNLDSMFEGGLQKEIESLTNDKMSLSLQKTEKIQSVSSEYDSTLLELSEHRAEYKTKISSLEKEIQKLKSVSDVCPTCGQKLPNVHLVDTIDLENEVKEYKLSLESVESKIDVANIKKTKEMYEVNLSFEESISAVSKRIDDLMVSKREMESLNRKKLALEQDILRVESSINSYSSTILAYENDIENTNNSICKLTESLSDLRVRREGVDNRLGIQKSFANTLKRDFRGVLLQSCITYINNKSKDYCEKIFGNRLMDFELDGNNVSIKFDGKEYESLSGGERQKVDLIIQFSIRSMLCSYLGFSCNLLVLDELMDNIDREGCKRVVDFISDVSSDVESIFLISHHTDLRLPSDTIMEVYKDSEGVSRISDRETVSV